MLLFIAKALQGKRPTRISRLLSHHISHSSTRSTAQVLLNVPGALSELVKASPFMHREQSTCTLQTLPSMNTFEGLLQMTM